jgi:hypothetical protein
MIMKPLAEDDISVASSEEGLLTDPQKESAHTTLKLLAELEASLKDGQSALLALDLGAMERHTADQCALSQSLEVLLLPAVRIPRGEGEDGLALPLSPKYAPELDAALRAAKNRVLHLTRVQAALLVRAQRFLAVLYNLTAGPGATYGPLLSQMSEIVGAAECNEAKGKDPCRV